ncbi:MAG: DUF2344 domain-containing protein [Clostridia bacterium]|nr:DUF2344 domain-containing protein [Clostridia bacterium]
MPVRVKFIKIDELQFISHLDLGRTMKSVMIRAGIPVHYTEGFNPHPKIVFALPLSVGAESVCEYMDFRTDREMDYTEIKDRLNAALPPQLRVLEAYEPVDEVSEICLAEYRITSDTPADFSPLSASTIVVHKRTKKGYIDTDIKPMIKYYSVDGDSITAVLSASPAEFLNPEYIAGILSLTNYTILRTRVFTSRGEFR